MVVVIQMLTANIRNKLVTFAIKFEAFLHNFKVEIVTFLLTFLGL